MADDNSHLPSTPATPRALADELGASGLPPSLQILLDEGLYNRMKQLSMLMARAEGFTPKHLLGKGEACFAIINTALDWKLNPHFVARHTYQTPGGSIGFDGALVQSVLERSGRFVGAPEIEYHGDWEKLTGKFERKRGQSGGEYVAATWTAADALGLGIIVRWQVRGENKPRAWPSENRPFWLTQCYPLNSPLWATDPKTQIAYLGIRRFANLAAPGILGAASFDYDEVLDASERARDVTPARRPQPEDYADRAATYDEAMLGKEQAETDDGIEIVGVDGDIETADDPELAVDLLIAQIAEARALGEDRLKGLWESNQSTIEEIEKADRKLVEPVYAAFREALASFDQQEQVQRTKPSDPGSGELREEGSADRPGDPLPTDAGGPPQSTSDGAPVARRRGRPPSTERRATQKQQETTSNSPSVNPQAAPQSPPAEPAARREPSSSSEAARPPSATGSSGSTGQLEESRAPQARQAAGAETREASTAANSPTRSATDERPPASLAVPLVQRGQGQTNWPETAKRMVTRVETCLALDEVKPLPFGRFRIENRQSMELMRTADHDAWVTVEYALGQQMRKLQIQQSQRRSP